MDQQYKTPAEQIGDLLDCLTEKLQKGGFEVYVSSIDEENPPKFPTVIISKKAVEEITNEQTTESPNTP